jgi:hypothetical protein
MKQERDGLVFVFVALTISADMTNHAMAIPPTLTLIPQTCPTPFKLHLTKTAL